MATFRDLALDVRPQLDAETLVWELLHREYDANRLFPDVHIQSEINLASNDFSWNGRLIVCSIGSPSQSESRAWIWRIPMTLGVIGSDPSATFELARDLHRAITGWPFAEPTSVGSVGRVLSFDGFQRVSKFKENQGKAITEYASDLVLEAHDALPRRPV